MEKFEAELRLISSPFIRDFVRKCIDKAPDYFWMIPSSSTGKHHPADENCVGGAVLHTQRMVRVADDLCRNFNVTGTDRDCVIAASIMHDFCKSGYPNNLGKTVAGHGCLWVNLIDERDALKSPEIAMIGRLIGTHMGHWDIPFTTATDYPGIIVQVSDYVVSREYVKVEILTTS